LIVYVLFSLSVHWLPILGSMVRVFFFFKPLWDIQSFAFRP